MLRSLLPLLLFMGSFCFSQNKTNKVIVDASTKQPVDYVFVSSDDNKITLISNSEGRLIILNNPKINYFTFYKIGYYTQKMTMDAVSAADTIFMKVKTFRLTEVNVSANTLEPIIKDKKHYVDDYIVLPNHDFLVLISGIGEHNKFFEVAYFKKDHGITDRKRIYGESNYFLFNDCFRNIHVVTEKYSRQVYFSSDTTFDFLPKYTKAKFDSTLAMCSLKLDSSLIFKSYLPPTRVKGDFFDLKKNSPFLTYFNISKKRKKIFAFIAFNKEIMAMYKNEISDTRMLMATMDAEGARRPSDGSYAAAMDLFFQKVAKPIYAPLFLKNDTIVLFNFQEEVIAFMTKGEVLLKEVKMKSQEISLYRDFEIIYDEATQKFYFKTKGFDKTYVGLFNIYTGSIDKTIPIEKTPAKNIQILDNSMYYLVKEKEWDDTCYLYEQKL